MKARSTRSSGFVVALLLLWCAPPLLSQQTPPDTAAALPDTAAAPRGFGGPSSVAGTLHRDAKVEAVILPSYFEFKAKVEKSVGLSFGFDFNPLVQTATASLGEKTAAGGAVRFFGQWTLIGRQSGNAGSLVFKVENRHRLGTDIAPQGLGSEIGYVGLTAVTYSDVRWVLTNLYWEQVLAGNRIAFVAGVVDVTDYVDVYGLVDPWTSFSNLAFSTSPTIAVPNQGLGAAVRGLITENVYVLGGLADANGDPSDPGAMFSSFFDTAEFFTHVEVGWVGSFDERFTDNVHLTAWHAAARKEAGVPSGWGLAFSFNRLLADKWEPFLRAGYSDGGGALWDGSIGVGLGYHVRKNKDLLGLGLNWGRPSEESSGPGLRDQYTVGLFYQYRPWRILKVEPGVQLLVNPALNPDADVIAVFAARARLAL